MDTITLEAPRAPPLFSWGGRPYALIPNGPGTSYVLRIKDSLPLFMVSGSNAERFSELEALGFFPIREEEGTRPSI